MSEKGQLYLAVIALMKEKSSAIGGCRQSEKDLYMLGELLREARDFHKAEASRLLREMADKLFSEGDERNAKAYLLTLSDDISPAQSGTPHLGRPA